MTNKVLSVFLDLLIKQDELINALMEENIALKQQNMQLKRVCKMHARAVDFYIKKLDEAENKYTETGEGDKDAVCRKGR